MKRIRTWALAGFCVLVSTALVGCGCKNNRSEGNVDRPEPPTQQELIGRYARLYREYVPTRTAWKKANAACESARKKADIVRKDYLKANTEAAGALKSGASDVAQLNTKARELFKQVLHAETDVDATEISRSTLRDKESGARQEADFARYRYAGSYGKASYRLMKIEKDFVSAATINPAFAAELEKRRASYFAAYKAAIEREMEYNSAYEVAQAAHKHAEGEKILYRDARARALRTGLKLDVDVAAGTLESLLIAQKNVRQAQLAWHDTSEKWEKLQQEYEDCFHAVIELPLN